MIRVLLVRHGETEWNGAGRLQGRMDIALSAAGRSQIGELVPVLAAFAPPVVVTSSLRRTRESAGALGLRIARQDPRLDEAHLGGWEGEYSARLQRGDPEAYRAWRCGELRPPGGESFGELTERVVAGVAEAVREAAAAGHGSVLLLTHGGPIRALLQHAVGLDPARAVPSHPASLSVLDVEEHRELGEEGACRLRLYNYAPSAALVEPSD
jgi:probable phosphoglycerate mutase